MKQHTLVTKREVDGDFRVPRGDDYGRAEVVSPAPETKRVTYIIGGGATAYSAGDLVTNGATTAPIQFTNFFKEVDSGGWITRIRLALNKKSISARFRLHFFLPGTITLAADNAAHKELYANEALRITSYDLGATSTAIDATNSDMSAVTDNDVRLSLRGAADSRDLQVVLQILDDAITLDAGQSITLTFTVDS